MKLSKQRIAELERAEEKLAALEAGGVDNWEWYGESLKGYFKKEEYNEKMDDLINELEQIFGECAYEPSERGAGIAFNDDIRDLALKTLAGRVESFKE